MPKPITAWEAREGEELIGFLGAEGKWLLWSRQTSAAVVGTASWSLRPNTDRERRNVFYGAWNGERLCRCADLAVLAQRHPDIYADLKQQCATFDWDAGE